MRKVRLGLVTVVAILALGIGGALAATARYTLPGDAVFPEGIAAGTTVDEFFVGSTTSGAVYRGTLNAPSAEPFLPGGVDGRTDVRGMKVDKRGRLYLAGGATGQLFVYDVATKALIAKFATGLTPSFVNDVTAPGAFSRWSDLAGSPIVYGQGFNLNGIAASADGQYLVVVQSNTGKLFRVEIATKAITEIDLGGQSVAAGDGLLIDRQNLWVMRNAAATLVTFHLADDFRSARLITTTTDPDFDFPTTFARLGDQLLVVNSQLNKRTANQPPTLPFTVVSLPVPGTTSSPVPSISPTVGTAPSPTATASAPQPPTVVPTPSVVVQPTPPATGSGGNLPGLPNTGDGGGSLGGSLALILALIALVSLGVAGVVRRRAMVRHRAD